jgi:acyl carrier protein
MNEHEIIYSLAEILEMEPADISPSTLLESIDTWDSLATISFIAFVDEKRGYVLAGDDLQNAKTVGDLIALAIG